MKILILKMKTRNNKKMNKNRKGNQRRNGRDGNGFVLDVVRSFPGQPVAKHQVQSFNTVLTTTVTTGVIASVISMDPTTIITNWSTRFASLYHEYRVVKARARIICFSATNPGTLLSYWDEKSNAAPTNAQSSETAFKRIAAADVFKEHDMTWKARDLLDLQYVASGTASNPVYWKLYTDAGNNGSAIAATNYATVDFRLLIEFRGFT
jgi:hypothetical protein